MTDRVGQQLGNYRLRRLLGRGGFAEVYLGEHLLLGTQAAVKVLSTHLREKDEVEEFEKEARMVAHLKHPHIVRILDYAIGEGTPFLVMDVALGGSLRQLHPQGTRLPVTTIISYVNQVADALQYAHDQRVIHRDVKPENMLVGGHDELLLSDFGIAIVAQSSRDLRIQKIGGTMAYVAPEQIQGHACPASDQYALGIVVYEWLSGTPPFQGSLFEIMTQHLAASPPSLREQDPTISSDVQQVVLTALEKDPHQRFKSVKAFATALEQAVQHTQASPAIPIVSWHPSVSAAEPGEQVLQAASPRVVMASSPGQVAFQSPLRSHPTVPLPAEPPSGSPALLSSHALPSSLLAQRLLPPDEPRIESDREQEAQEHLENEPPAALAPSRSYSRGLVGTPRRKFLLAMSIVVAIALLVALSNTWIFQLLTHAPGSTPMLTVTTAPAGTISEFAIPIANISPQGITAGPDGNLWFTEVQYDDHGTTLGSKIGRISLNGTITQFPLPITSEPEGITTGPDHNLWFTEKGSNKIGRISPNGTITQFPLPIVQSEPEGITTGPDHNLWFTEQSGNKIGRISPNGTITQFPLPIALSLPLGITAGPDHNLWFTEYLSNKIGRISPNGTITEYTIPTPTSEPQAITVGPDGNLWFTEQSSDKIGRISPNGTITEFPFPTIIGPEGITAGPDGNLWFTTVFNTIGRISVNGRITLFPPTIYGISDGITAGPDGNLWFTEDNQIGRISPGRSSPSS